MVSPRHLAASHIGVDRRGERIQADCPRQRGFGFFFTLFALFVRAMPSVAIAEMKEAMHPPMRHPEIERKPSDFESEFASERLED